MFSTGRSNHLRGAANAGFRRPDQALCHSAAKEKRSVDPSLPTLLMTLAFSASLLQCGAAFECAVARLKLDHRPLVGATPGESHTLLHQHVASNLCLETNGLSCLRTVPGTCGPVGVR